jgi:hypothetical protein
MDVLERIRRGYHAVGPGAPRAVLAMFHQEQDDAPEWVVRDVADTGRIYATRDVVAMDLFGGLPGHWEVTGAELRMWDFYERRSRLVVAGRFRTRPRGTWEVVMIPFIHIWTVSGDQVQSVMDFLAGIEVRRRGALQARRRIRWWRRSADAEGESSGEGGPEAG